MKPINEERKTFLEGKFGIEICPFNVEKFIDRPKEFSEERANSSNLDRIEAYRCYINGQPAIENIVRLFGYSLSLVPCSIEFAVHNCPLYRKYG